MEGTVGYLESHRGSSGMQKWGGTKGCRSEGWACRAEETPLVFCAFLATGDP